MSTIIKLRCIDQVLTFDSTPLIASGGVEEDRVQVEFCSKWDGLIKTAVFWRNEKDAYHVLMDEDDSAAIPKEVLIDEGRIYLGFFGVSAEEKQRTSQVLAYNVVKGAITLDAAPDNPTVDLYTQLLAKYLEMVQIAEDVKTEAERNQEEFEQEIKDLIAQGLLPDGSVSTEKLKDGAVTAEKIAPGALYTKEETLSSATKAVYGLGPEAVPTDVFMALKIPAGYYGFTVTAKFDDGTPAANLELLGLLDFNLNTAITDEDGFCYALTTALTQVVDFTNYVGIVSKTVTLQIDESRTYTAVEITVEKDTAPRLIETSGDVRCYEGGLLDICAVGAGGAGGGDCRYGRAGGGGGGGSVTNVLGLPSVKSITVSIGAGGAPAGAYSGGAVSGAGGATTVTIAGEVVASANGGGGGQNASTSGHGAGGVGNGNGGSKSAGGDGTVRVFDDPELPLPGGGGASGNFEGGADFGGSGGYQKTGTSGTGPGGGGAGSDGYNADKNIAGAAGHAGGVYVRVRFE